MNPAGLAYYRAFAQAYFTVEGIPQLVQLLVSAQIRAEAEGFFEVEVVCAELAQSIVGDLNRVAAEIALLADKEIVAKISETRATNRPPAFAMETHIHSQSTGLGSVAVALTEELDKIINPVGEWGPFWRAQEYGTGQSNEGGSVPTQVGRVFLGTFDPSTSPPDPGQAGLRQGQDQGFVPGGANPGWGTISVDLPGRHFIRDGAAIAGADYERKMLELQTKYVGRIAEAVELIRRTFTTGRGFTGLIEA